MVLHASRRLLSASTPVHIAITAVMLGAAGCSGGPGAPAAEAAPGWSDSTVNAVSRPVSASGFAAVTGLRPDGQLETAVYDLAAGKRRWSRPSTMAGRLPGMGVQPPAVFGPARAPVVASVEPRKVGRWRAMLVARDARTGAQRWTRPVDSTFGPVRCGIHVCMSEFTARPGARFVALDSATGRPLWRMPGIAEVEWSDERRVVVFRMAQHPVLESRDLRTGRTLWSFPVERAVGPGVDLSGGWAFTSLGETLVGYLGPYQRRRGRPLSAFGFFGLRMSDGRPVWTRQRLLRVYPSAGPAVSLMARQVDTRGMYGDFAQLDPRTGRTIARVPAAKAPRTAWWLAFPSDLSTLGFLSQGRPGTAVDLRRGTDIAARGLRTWSFCTVNPAELRIRGHRGFFPIAPLCAYDLGTGGKVANPGPPPGWYTGAVDGWRVWRDEQGALRAVRDAKGTSPGMYG
ncbi:PQQ-binding-like beta-propeller repeat protein [Thermomonospora umbrina]|uniref:Putative pyrroloquinoline-quinone binding quinoprotein n=1 Tax=Thermomonospora umbrina TaxID=111806 RepID=A0A3D9SWW3_9ACTN|nr:PQQ-binding-like beta-propeller repeat protein [Thermomonospora umbrina]REE96111.1 putative pyrroloquinoline-quinone binding quinoprotein [Thermomonospora umbrina]